MYEESIETSCVSIGFDMFTDGYFISWDVYKRQVFSHLSESGKLIIRDWCAPEDEALASVEVIPEKIEEVKRWIKELSEHAIFLSEVVVKGNIIQASVDDLYNILLHVTWGQQSILRESNESYLVDRCLLYTSRCV